MGLEKKARRLVAEEGAHVLWEEEPENEVELEAEEAEAEVRNGPESGVEVVAGVVEAETEAEEIEQR